MTTAPGLIQSAVTCCALPIATTTTSACDTSAAGLVVLLWQIVTVAFRPKSNRAIGSPTNWDRPMTTQCLPDNSTPLRSNNSKHPNGVQGIEKGASIAFPSWYNCKAAVLMGCNPSTSLVGSTARKIVSWFKCFGNGNWINIPWTLLLWFNSCMVVNNSSSVTVSLKSYPTEMIPASLQAFFFILT